MNSEVVYIWKDNIRSAFDHFRQWIKRTSYYPLLYKDLNQAMANVDEPIQLLITGGFSSGKTTFINAFVGEEILSSSPIPETAMVTKLVYGETRELSVTYHDGRSDIFPFDWLASLSTDREGPASSIKPYISKIEIRLPIDLLKFIHMIDTPGLDANNEHDKMTERVFQQADAAIWLFYLESTGKVKEFEYIKQLKEYRVPIYGIINQVDDLVEAVDDEEEEQVLEDLEDIIERVQVKTDHAFVEKPMGITAYHALQAKVNNAGEELALTNWPLVEEMFQRIKNEESLKQDKMYHQLGSHLSRLLPEMEKVKASLPIQKYKHFCHNFNMEDFRSKVGNHSEQIDTVEKVYEKWKQLQHMDGSTTDGFEQLDVLLLELKDETPQVMDDQNNRFHTIRDEWRRLLDRVANHHHSLKDYQNHKKELEDWGDQLEHRWVYLKEKKFWGIRRLLDFEYEQISQRKTYMEIQNVYKKLEDEQSSISNEAKDLNQKFQSFVSELRSSLDVYHQKQINNANQFVTEKQEEYANLTEDNLSSIHTFLKDIRRLVDGIEPAFEKRIEVESFQQSYDAFKKLSLLNEGYDFTEENLQDGKELDNIEPFVKVEDEFFTPSIEGTFGKQGSLYPPRKATAHPVPFVIEKIRKKRKRAFMVSALAIIIFFIVQTGALEKITASQPVEQQNDEPSTPVVEENGYDQEAYEEDIEQQAKEDNQTDDESATSSEVAFENEPEPEPEPEPESESEPEPEPEPTPIHLPFDKVERFLGEYRNQYFSALNRKNFSIVRPYLVEGSQAYTVLENYIVKELPEIYEFRDQEIEVLSVSEVLEDGTVYVETYETFTYEDENGNRNYYKKDKEYTLKYEQGSLSVQHLKTVSDELEVEPLDTLDLVSHQDIYDFMYSHQMERFRAMNSNAIESVSHFYDEDGSAKEALEQEMNAYNHESEQIGLQEINVSAIEKEGATHYSVDVEVQQVVTNEEEEIQVIQDQLNRYRISVNRDGSMEIVDRTLQEVRDEKVVVTENDRDEVLDETP